MVLRVEGLSKKYAATVLENVNVSVRAGESVALVGANGAGKSTLMKILLGLAAPDSGTVEMFGAAPGSRIALAKVGYLPELPSFWPELDAFEFLEALAVLRDMPIETRRPRIEALLSALGLANRGRRPMGGYSKGMLQRAGVAQCLLHDPELLVLDEPMSGLDPRAQEKLRLIFRAQLDKGKTFLVSSHSIEDIRQLCTRVIAIEKGRIVRDGPAQEVLGELVERYRSSEPWDEDPMSEEGLRAL